MKQPSLKKTGLTWIARPPDTGLGAMGSGLVMTVFGVLGEGELWEAVGAGLGRIGTTGLGPAKFRRGGMECLLCLAGEPNGMGLLAPNLSPGTGL